MRGIRILAAATAVVSMLSLGVAMAQQPTHQHGEQPTAQAPNPATPGQGHDAHHAQHLEMCRQMMGQAGRMGEGMMGGGMMGMPMMIGGDPKQQSEMLAMRGEMMKAMGDIMMKYAQRAQSAK